MSKKIDLPLPTKEDLVAALGAEAVEALLSDPTLVKSRDTDEADIVQLIGLAVSGSGCMCAACAKIRETVAGQPGGAALTEEWTGKNGEALIEIEKESVAAAARERATLAMLLAGLIMADRGGATDPLKDDSVEGMVSSAEVNLKSTASHEITLKFTTDANIDDKGWDFAAAVTEAMFRTVPDRVLVAIARSAISLEPVLIKNLERIAEENGEEYAADDIGAPYIAAFSLTDDADVVTRFALMVEDLDAKRAAIAAAREELIRWSGSDAGFAAGQGLFAHAGVDPRPFGDAGVLAPEDVARHVRAWVLYGPGTVTFQDDSFAAIRALPPGERKLCARVAKRYGWATDDRIAKLNEQYEAD